MVVFYSETETGSRRIDAITWLTGTVLSIDISWWAVPGTLEDKYDSYGRIREIRLSSHKGR